MRKFGPTSFQKLDYLEEIDHVINEFWLVSVNNLDPFKVVKKELRRLLGKNCKFGDCFDLPLIKLMRAPHNALVVVLGTTVRGPIRGDDQQGHLYLFTTNGDLNWEPENGVKDLFRGNDTYALVAELEEGAIKAAQKKLFPVPA